MLSQKYAFQSVNPNSLAFEIRASARFDLSIGGKWLRGAKRHFENQARIPQNT